jgi:hypothetical protein
MDTIALQNQIIELQKQLDAALIKEKKKEERKTYMREYMKKKYHDDLEGSRELTRKKQHKHYHTVKKPQNDLLKTYELLEGLKTKNPEYLEQIKCILSN